MNIMHKLVKTEKQYLVYGIHPVEEALRSGRTIDKVFVRQGSGSSQTGSLVHTIRNLSIPVQFVPVEKLNRITSKNHQGIIAYLSPIEFTDLTMLLPTLFEQGKTPFLIALDGITDVRNFGGIARTVECAGADAVLIPVKGSVTVNPDAIHASAGALNRIAVCREKNLLNSLIYLKESGLQIIGASEKASGYFYRPDYTLPTVLVFGAEDAGISQAVLERVDHLVKIPLMGSIQSLNVGIAASVMMYEVLRQRNPGFLDLEV